MQDSGTVKLLSCIIFQVVNTDVQLQMQIVPAGYTEVSFSLDHSPAESAAQTNP